MAPSKAERSHDSSVTKNFLAKLKKAEGLFDTLTAIVCLGLSVVGEFVSFLSCSDDTTESEPVGLVSNVDGLCGPALSAKLKDDSWSCTAPVSGPDGCIVLDDCTEADF